MVRRSERQNALQVFYGAVSVFDRLVINRGRRYLSAYDLTYRAVYGLMCRGCGVL